jgi:hypothetical protein
MNASIAKALLKVAPRYRDTWHTTKYLADAITHEYELDDGALTSLFLATATSKYQPFKAALGSCQGLEIDDKTMMYEGVHYITTRVLPVVSVVDPESIGEAHHLRCLT